MPGVSDLNVNLSPSAPICDWTARLPQVQDMLEQAGYPAQLTTTRLSIEGMSCASCSGRITRVRLARPDVAQAQVTHAPDLTPDALPRLATDMGYPSQVVAPDRPAASAPDAAPALRRGFLVAFVLTLPIFLAEMGGHLVQAFHHWLHGVQPLRALWLAQMVLTLAVLAGPGRRFFTTGLPALCRGTPEMNSLVALGAGTAFLFPAVVTRAPGLVPTSSLQIWFGLRR